MYAITSINISAAFILPCKQLQILPFSTYRNEQALLSDFKLLASMESTSIDEEDVELLDKKFDIWLLIPILMPFFAYTSFDSVQATYSMIYDFLASGKSFSTVDGGALQTKMISPTLNGIVLPTSSLLFSTLVSTTIGTLRNRITIVKECLTKEAGDLQKLNMLSEYFPPRAKKESQVLLYNYCRRLIQESSDSFDHEEFAGSTDVEISKFMIMLNDISNHRWEGMEIIPAPIIGQSLSTVDTLTENRLTRMTQLREPFPLLHYIIIFVLSTAIIFSFLMQTNDGECVSIEYTLYLIFRS